MTKLRHLRLVPLLLAIAGLAALTSSCRPNYGVKVIKADLTLPCGSGTNVVATWAIPDGVAPKGLIWLQHGFARSADNIADLQRRYAARGDVVVAPSLAAFGSCAINTKEMHAAVAAALVGSTSPSSALQTSYAKARAGLGLPAATLPSTFVVSGHSAGGALATVAAGAVASDPSAGVRARLKGVVLLDPVENSDNGMAAALPKLTGVRVLTISGGDSTCNANSSGTKVLLPNRTGFAGVRLPSGCHCDAEADTTDGTCTLLCGTPKQANKDALRLLAADWASDMLAGTTTAAAYPGGQDYEQLKAAGTIQTLTGTK
jgi:dienelactone hydrolase